MGTLTSGGLLLVIGAVFTIAGIVFFPFLCAGIPLLVVGLILVVAESGPSKAPMKHSPPGYGPYGPYVQPPPAAPPPASGSFPPVPTTGAGRSCANCGAPLAAGTSFCPNCGARVLG